MGKEKKEQTAAQEKNSYHEISMAQPILNLYSEIEKYSLEIAAALSEIQRMIKF